MDRTCKLKNFTVALIIAATFILICSKNSFLYPMNDWVDVNIFFTAGRMMKAGRVMYVNIIDHKGPIVYFAYALAAMISENTFIGVFILEIVSVAAFIYFSGKIAGLYLEKQSLIYTVMVAVCASVVLSDAFSHGGSVEEETLFASACSIFLVLKALKEKRSLLDKEALIIGLLAGVVFWVKFNLCGLYIGMGIFVVVWYICSRYTLQQFLKTAGWFVAGILTVTLLVLPYFVINNGLRELFDIYFYKNIFSYGSSQGGKLQGILNSVLGLFASNKVFMIPAALGIGLFLKNVKTKYMELVLLALTFVVMAVGIFWSGNGYRYYTMPFAVYSVFGFTFLAALAEKVNVQDKMVYSVAAVAVAVILAGYVRFGSNAYLLGVEKQDMPQYKFADIINETENPSVLIYGMMDAGFYYAGQVLPESKYYFTANISVEDFPEMQAIPFTLIHYGVVDYAITRDATLEEHGLDNGIYECAGQETFVYEGADRTYYIYKKIS